MKLPMKLPVKLPVKLKGELVVVTGANGGIGKALCKEYLALGAVVCAFDLSNENLSHELKEFREKLFFYNVDVSNEKSILEALSKMTEEFKKPPFIWINNAGIARVDHFENISSAEFDKILDVNIKGVIYGTRAALSVMKNPERGHIANVSSVNGAVATPFMAAYVASKHAVDGFTRSIQIEKSFKHSAVKIHLVSPGFARTKIMPQEGEFTLPKAFDFMVADPHAVAIEIINGINSGKNEIRPTLHAKLIIEAVRLMPALNKIGSRLLVAKSWKEVIGFNPIKQRK